MLNQGFFFFNKWLRNKRQNARLTRELLMDVQMDRQKLVQLQIDKRLDASFLSRDILRIQLKRNIYTNV